MLNAAGCREHCATLTSLCSFEQSWQSRSKNKEFADAGAFFVLRRADYTDV